MLHLEHPTVRVAIARVGNLSRVAYLHVPAAPDLCWCLFELELPGYVPTYHKVGYAEDDEKTTMPILRSPELVF